MIPTLRGMILHLRCTSLVPGVRRAFWTGLSILLVSVAVPSNLFASGLAESAVEIQADRAQDGGGVGSNAEQAGAIVATDALGRDVRVTARPERIVLAGRAVLMVADAVYAFPDASDRVVGIGRIRQGRGSFIAALDPSMDQKTILERNVGPEQIASLDPDLVILKTFMRDPLGLRLESLGISVFYVDLETPEQYERDLAGLGNILGEPERARALNAYYAQEQAAVTERVAGLPDSERPNTLLLYARANDQDIAFQVAPDAWIQTQMVELAGGQPVWRGSNPGGGWATVSFEQIAAWDPDHIAIIAYDGSAAVVRDDLQSDTRWQQLSAVSAGNLHAFPMDFYSWDQPDTRWILGLGWMAKTLHPNLFADYRIEQAMRSFFATLYGLTNLGFDQIIAPTLAGDID